MGSSRFIDLTGQTFTRLTVVRKSGNTKTGSVVWRKQNRETYPQE